MGYMGILGYTANIGLILETQMERIPENQMETRFVYTLAFRQF